jgi:hypothetical protein
MRRIELVVVLTLSLVVAPLTVQAQPTPARLPMLLTGPPADVTAGHAAFTKELGDLDRIERQPGGRSLVDRCTRKIHQSRRRRLRLGGDL